MKAMVLSICLALAIGGCAVRLPPPSPSVPPTGSPTGSPPASTTPSPTLLPSPSQPPPTHTPVPILHVDGLATIAVDELRRFVDPARPNKNSQLPRDYAPLRAGQLAFLVDGPLRVADREYWQLSLGPADPFGQLGWAPATDESGAATLVPFEPTCPPVEGLGAAALNSLGGLQALVCFGGRELTLRGDVECNRATADGGIGGAYYFDSNRHCVLDGVLTVYGDTVTAILGQDPLAPTVSGAYELRGHMDDHGARGCGLIPIGVSHDAPTTPDPAAVMWCRQNVVVTGLTPIE